MTLSNVVTGIRLVPLLRAGYQDFTIFYAAANMVRSGHTADLYDLPAQYRAQQQFAPKVGTRQGALPYNHPPFEALFFVPFTFLPYVPAYLLWTFVNLSMLAASLIILGRQFPEVGTLSPIFLVLVAAGFAPVASAVIQGQDSILLLFLCILALAALNKQREIAAGAFLAFALFKFHLVLPLVLILAVRRWRLLLGFAPVAAALAALSVAMVGWSGAIDYFHFIFGLEKSGAGGAIVGGDMPNLRGVLSRMPGVHPGSAIFVSLTVACSIALVLIVMWRVRTKHTALRFAFTLATVVAILVSYHTLTYDLSLLLPVVLLLLTAPTDQNGSQTRADTILFVLVYLLPFCEPFWPRLNQFWFLPVVYWIFSELGRRQPAGVSA